MSNLIDDLKKEHAFIGETLNKVRSLGITSKEGQSTLLAAKSGLLAHLQKEDERLYPVLNKAADNDPNLKQTLQMFAAHMEAISAAALGFFEKYSGGGSGAEFAKDFGNLNAELSMRISREEDILYKRYNELMTK